MKLSASIHCTACRSASGWPKVTRCLAYCVPSSRQRSITPMLRAPWRMRPTLSQCCACRKPSPSSPMRFSTGTLTSSKAISHGRSSTTSSCGAQQPHARRLHVDDEGGNAAARALRAVGRRDQLREMRLVGAGDEALHAVDDVVIALAHRGRAHAAGIAAGVGLGLGQAPVQLAADGRQQVLLLLLVVEVIEDRADVGAEDVDAARGQRDGAAELGPHRDLGDQPHAEPAVFLRHVVAGKPELLGLGGEMRAHLGLELVVLARGALDRDQLAIDELADGVLEHPDFFRKLEVQAVRGGHCVHSVSSYDLRRTTRTSTARTPSPLASTISGLISRSDSHGR